MTLATDRLDAGPRDELERLRNNQRSQSKPMTVLWTGIRPHGIGEAGVAKLAHLGHTLGATVHTDVVVADHDEEAIVERAQHDVDLVVMASSRSRVTQRAFLGHHVDYVVRHASCPVLVVNS